jgi:prolyl-tRNA synthetase
MGGSGSAEFQVLVQSGEDVIAACLQCSYAANLEVAKTPPMPRRGPDPESVPAREKIHTPGKGKIESVARLLKQSPANFLKSLVYLAEKDLVMVVLRGDHDVNEVKLARALGVNEVHLASGPDVERATGAAIGFAGPIGFAGRVVIDVDAASLSDAVTGANETDYHFLHVQHGRDFTADVVEVRQVMDGDMCLSCGASLKLYRGIEAGHIFLLGTHYTSKMSATYLDEKGEHQTIVMGCYGIGVSRLIAAAVEQHHDDNGILWPISIAPYQVHLVQLGTEPEVVAEVLRLERELEAAGIEVLVDDREERPGVKFKDADLIGIPLRATIGARGLKTGQIEFKQRSESDPKQVELLPQAEAATMIAGRVRDLLRQAGAKAN